MKFLLTWALSLTLTLLIAPTQLSATANFGEAESTNKLLSRYAGCVVKRHTKDVTKFLLLLNWDTKQNRQLQAFSQKTAGCLGEDQHIDVDDNIIRGLFAGSLFVMQNGGNALTDYSKLPVVFDKATISPDATFRLASLSLAECVFRADPQGVTLLLKSELNSGAERLAYRNLTSNLGGCGGTQNSNVIASGIPLRGVLGEAAYAITQRYQLSIAESAGGK